MKTKTSLIILIVGYLFISSSIKAQNTFPSTGNVGIGTANPNALLHIDGDTKYELLISGKSPALSLTTSPYSLTIDPASIVVIGQTREFFPTTTFGDLLIKGQTNGNILFGTQAIGTSPAIERMRITNSGDLGIGIANPESKLHIDGNITTPSFKTNNKGVIKIRDYGAGENQYNRALFPVYDAALNNTQLIINRLGDFEKGVNVEGDKLTVNGNLGVGIADPEVKLHIAGGIPATLTDGGYVTIGNSESSNLVIDNNEIQARNIGNYSSLHLQPKGGNLFIHNEGSDEEKISIRANGDVGLGTNNPNAKLHIADGAAAGLTFGGYIIAGATDDNNIVIDTNEIQSRNDGATASLFIQPKGGNLFINSFTGNEEDRIAFKNGKLAIGTNDPRGYKLAVNGNILTEELKIRTYANWPDYVFEEDYNLKSLTDLENEIKTLGHLPNIPSAKEVKQEGFNIGEMNAALLQKVEELTLHTINQQKDIEDLKSLVNKLLDK